MNKKIYARHDNGLVEEFFSTIFAQPQEGDIFVEEGDEDYHAHVHLKYTAFDEIGCHNYKVINKEIIPTTVIEKRTEFDNRIFDTRHTQQDRINELEKQLSDMQNILKEIIQNTEVKK